MSGRLDTIRSASDAAAVRYRRHWIDEFARLIRTGATDQEIETYVRTVRLEQAA